MAKNQSFQELAKSWNNFDPSRGPRKYEWIRVPVEREEEPDIVELTPREVEAVGAVLLSYISAKRVQRTLKINFKEAELLLAHIHSKLIDG